MGDDSWFVFMDAFGSLHPSLRSSASFSTQPPCRNRGANPTSDSVGPEHRAQPVNESPWSHATPEPSLSDGADGPKSAPADHFARSLRQSSVPRIALIVWLGLADGSHHSRRCRDLASSRAGRDRWGISPASLSHALIRWRHGIPRQHCMRSWLRAVRVLPGNAAKAARSFFPDRFRSLWRPLQPRRRCADRERSGPP